MEVAFPEEVIGPVKLALVVTDPAVKPAAVPVIFVPTRADGVPRLGVTKVGLVARTTEPVPEVVPAVRLPPLVVATTGTLAPMFVVMVAGEIVANVAVPVNVGPADIAKVLPVPV